MSKGRHCWDWCESRDLNPLNTYNWDCAEEAYDAMKKKQEQDKEEGWGNVWLAKKVVRERREEAYGSYSNTI